MQGLYAGSALDASPLGYAGSINPGSYGHTCLIYRFKQPLIKCCTYSSVIVARILVCIKNLTALCRHCYIWNGVWSLGGRTRQTNIRFEECFAHRYRRVGAANICWWWHEALLWSLRHESNSSKGWCVLSHVWHVENIGWTIFLLDWWISALRTLEGEAHLIWGLFFSYHLYFILHHLPQVLLPHLEPLSEQQRLDLGNLAQSCQQAEDALSQGMEKLHQILGEAIANKLGEGNYLPQIDAAIEKLEALVRFVGQVNK